MSGRPARSEEPRVDLLRNEGISHYNERRYFQAIRCFEAAIELAGPDRAAEFRDLLARARSALGVELFNSGEIRQAGEAFQEALRHSEDAYAEFGLGLIHFVRLEDEKALERLRAAERLDPENAKVHKLLALLDYRQGHGDEARTRMEKAARLDPKDREARALLDRWKAEASSTSGFVDRSARGFAIRADPEIPAERVAEVSRRLEEIRLQIGSAFQLEMPRRVVVVLFAPERFYRATGSFHWVGGFYDGQIKLPVRGGAEPSADDARELDEALRHEIAHVAVRSVCPECPNWLNEGIAQHFERRGRVGDVDVRLREKPAARIRFEDVPARLWEVDDEEIALRTYLQGLSFVEFLVDRFHEFRLRLLLESLHREGSLKKAFEITYGIPLADAEAQWWARVMGAESAR